MSATMKRFEGKTAMVAGAASGIGLAIARGLVAEGARVVGGDINAEMLAAAAAELGDRFVSQSCDVTREADCEVLVATAIERFGTLDCAFNVAGASRPGYIVDLDESDWDFTVDFEGRLDGDRIEGSYYPGVVPVSGRRMSHA